MHTRHKIKATTCTQVATRAHNTTQRVHNSNRALVALTKNQMREIEVLVLRNALRMLGVLLHAPRGPFYSPKAARSR
jgi:lipid II:glycine glycyltransferase (peptidoglycan interpeptide bridge formation enzyme)